MSTLGSQERVCRVTKEEMTMAKNSIRLSEKHGVTPTIPVCFGCGKQKNEIALLGRLPNDAEAPMNMVLNYDPCEECLSQ